MSGQSPTQKAAPKNIYGRAKLDTHLAEKASRREEHEADFVAHDRNTRDSQHNFKYYTQKKAQLQANYNNAQARINAIDVERVEQEQKMREQVEYLRKLEEEWGARAKKGEKDAEISRKYGDYLGMKSDRLDL
jgi:chromosome segregation ATPase